MVEEDQQRVCLKKLDMSDFKGLNGVDVLVIAEELGFVTEIPLLI